MIWLQISLLNQSCSIVQSSANPRHPVIFSDNDWDVQSPKRNAESSGSIFNHSQFRFRQEKIDRWPLETGVNDLRTLPLITGSNGWSLGPWIDQLLLVFPIGGWENQPAKAAMGFRGIYDDPLQSKGGPRFRPVAVIYGMTWVFWPL